MNEKEKIKRMEALLKRLVDIDWCIGYELTTDQMIELDSVRASAYAFNREQESIIQAKKLVIQQLKECQKNTDKEAAGGCADVAIRNFLIALDYEDVVDEWDKVERWYA